MNKGSSQFLATRGIPVGGRARPWPACLARTIAFRTPGCRSLLAGDSRCSPPVRGEIACQQAPTKTAVRLILKANWNEP